MLSFKESVRPIVPSLISAGFFLAGSVFPTFAASDAEESGMGKEDLKVLSEEAAGLLHAYLLDAAQSQFEARRSALEKALASPEGIEARQETLRKSYRAIVGSFPERTPLNPETTGRIECDGYRIEKIAFESRPNFHVTANCYVPAGNGGPYPGVLVPCGHTSNGKAAESYQRACILLALNGFVALIVDPICQGERYQFLDASGRPATRGGTTSHTLLDVGAKLVGTSVVAYEVWDNIRGIDYLSVRPDVDRDRIGVTGNSGGGTQTTFLIPLDDRIQAAAPSCFIMTRERLFETIGPQDGCQHLFAEGASGIEHADYIAMFAPKPLRILAAEKDFFDIGATREAYKEVKRVYEALGVPERVDLFSHDDEHGFSRPRREAAVQWMRRWLMDDGDPVEEPERTVQKEKALWVTPTGQVGAHWKKEVTVADLNLEEARALEMQRRNFWQRHSKAEWLWEVRRLIGMRENRAVPKVEEAGTLDGRTYRIEKLVIRRPGEVPVPGLLFLPKSSPSKQSEGRFPAVLYLDGRGKEAGASPGGPIEDLLRKGRIVLAVDLRGFGETEDRPGENAPKLWNREHRLAVISMHIGRPLMGQRVEDALAALDVLLERKDVDPSRIALLGIGRAGPVALHAAALDERFIEVRLKQSIRSFVDIVAAPLTRDMLTHVVPFALTRYDLPDLVRVIAPRSVAADASR